MPEACSSGRAAPRAEEHELGVHVAAVAAVDVLDAHGPARAIALEAGHAFAVLDLGIGRAGQVVQQLVGQGAEVDVGAVLHTGRGDFLVERAPGIISGIHSTISLRLRYSAYPKMHDAG